MKIYRLVVRCAMSALPLVLLMQVHNAGAQKNANSYACKEADATALCGPANTCTGSCSVDVKRTTNGASATPGIPGMKGNSTFCAKVGTTLTFKSDTKHQGFIVDMGPKTPFNLDDIIGGSDKSVTVTAKTPGCYRYSVGACISGEIYGMCGNSYAEIVILK